MIYGLVHFVFLIASIVIGICFIFTLRKYLYQRNKFTLLFSIFLLTYVVSGIIYFVRGLYEAEMVEDILLFKFTLITPMILATLFAFFIIFPLISQKEGTITGFIYKALITIFGIECILEAIVVIISEAEFTFIQDGLAHYSLIPFIPNYAFVLFAILSTAIIVVFFLVMMVLQEAESFYRTKAILLLVGWLLIFVGQAMFLSPATALLTPPMGGSGFILTAIALLRQPPN